MSAARETREYALAVFVLLGLSAVAFAVDSLTGYMFPALLFLMAVVLGGLRWKRGPVLVLATLSAVVWNFLFIPPRFTLHIAKPEDAFMFGIFFLVALSMGHLTSQLHQRERALERRQMETEALLRVVRSAAFETDLGRGLEAAVRLIGETLQTPVSLLIRDSKGSLTSLAGSAFPPPTEEQWQRIRNLHREAGSAPLYLAHDGGQTVWRALVTPRGCFGVMGFRMPMALQPGDGDWVRLQEAMCLQIAMVVEKEHLLVAQRRAAIAAEAERLQRILFDSVSHELKTPIAIIRTALDGLPEGNPMVDEIEQAARRLQRIVDDFLEMTRVESASIQIQREWTDVSDVLEAAKESVACESAGRVILECGFLGLPLLRVDGRLLVRALGNLLQNALIYSPSDAPVQVEAHYEGGTLSVKVMDRGRGVPESERQAVFRKFYRLPGSPPGGTGLGLPIARGLLRVHGGEITISNRGGGGTEAQLRVPAEALNQEAWRG
jgi:two-component system sensor histidine kinase KdpD